MNLYRILSVAIVVAVLGGSFGLAATASAQAPTATVNTGALNIRSGPGIGYGVVFSVYRGVSMTLLARNGDASWVRISLDNGVQGWVNSGYIATSYPLYSLPLDGSGGPVAAILRYPVWGGGHGWRGAERRAQMGSSRVEPPRQTEPGAPGGRQYF